MLAKEDPSSWMCCVTLRPWWLVLEAEEAIRGDAAVVSSCCPPAPGLQSSSSFSEGFRKIMDGQGSEQGSPGVLTLTRASTDSSRWPLVIDHGWP